MKYFDFTNYKLSNRSYGGSEKKIGIKIGDYFYMLKFRKRTPLSTRNNTISEYIGSHIYQMLGFNCQDTFLGEYCGQQVVACKDFIENGFQFVPFNEVGESTIEEDRDKYQYSYDDIVLLLESNMKLTKVRETISSFFDIFIVDALIGNFDRHGANWGFLKKNNKYVLAPVFDNGSCLFPNLTDENEMRLIVDDEDEMNKRVYQFPTSQIKLHGEKSSYFQVISSLQFPEINESLKRIYPRINLNDINVMIDEISVISDVQKTFYKNVLKNRYEKILMYSYKKLTEENK